MLPSKRSERRVFRTQSAFPVTWQDAFAVSLPLRKKKGVTIYSCYSISDCRNYLVLWASYSINCNYAVTLNKILRIFAMIYRIKYFRACYYRKTINCGITPFHIRPHNTTLSLTISLYQHQCFTCLWSIIVCLATWKLYLFSFKRHNLIIKREQNISCNCCSGERSI